MNKIVVAAFCLLSLWGCSKAGSTPTSPNSINQAPIIVHNAAQYTTSNVAYTTVTICLPGNTSECTTIDNIIVDTGSTGLRIFASADTNNILNQLTPSTPTDGGSGIVAECYQFGSTWTWGTVAKADLYIGGNNIPGNSEVSPALPIDILSNSIASPPYPPETCWSTGTFDDLGGANGVLGINPARYDNNSAATDSTDSYYYDCSGNKNSNCTQATFSLVNQVRNPIISFSPDINNNNIADNNGAIISLPDAPNVGSTALESLNGTLIFGIGTRNNNDDQPVNIFFGDPSTPTKNIQTFYATLTGNMESSYPVSLLDSGSNAFVFTDNTIPTCAGESFSEYYCPDTTPQALQAQIASYNTTSNAGLTTQNFAIIKGQSYLTIIDGFQSYPMAVIPGLAINASVLEAPATGVFTWGLPFFYGKNIYIGIESAVSNYPESISVTGPYFGF